VQSPEMTDAQNLNFENEKKKKNEKNEHEKKHENLSCLYEELLIGSLDVTIVEKGQIALNISNSLSLIIMLEPIDTDGKAADRSYTGTIHHTSNDVSDDRLKDNKSDLLCRINHQLNYIIYSSILKIQLSLLSQWNKSLDIRRSMEINEKVDIYIFIYM
jgi:hypothetical protein